MILQFLYSGPVDLDARSGLFSSKGQKKPAFAGFYDFNVEDYPT